VFTARYALSPYIKQIRFVFEGLIYNHFKLFVLHCTGIISVNLPEFANTDTDAFHLTRLYKQYDN
jgi:hypothetical protein